MARSKATAGTPRMFIAIESGVAFYGGGEHPINAGETRVEEGHPILNGREHMFKPLEAHYRVEAATQAPGETRGEEDEA